MCATKRAFILQTFKSHRNNPASQNFNSEKTELLGWCCLLDFAGTMRDAAEAWHQGAAGVLRYTIEGGHGPPVTQHDGHR